MLSFDVAIVGAGPAGCAAAITLGRLGYSVVLLDKEKFPRDKLCGDFLNPSSWPALRQLGLQTAILAQVRERIDRFQITSHLGAEAEVALPRREGEPGYGVSLSRAALDAILLEGAQRDHGVALEQHKVKNLCRREGGWSIRTAGPAGQYDLAAKVLLGADGRNSWIARHQGLARAESMRGRAVGFQLRLSSRYDVAGKIAIHLFPGGYGGVSRLEPGLINFAFAVDKQTLESAGGLTGLLSSHVQQSRHLKTLLQSSQQLGPARSTYPVYFPSRRCYAERLLLVGDAARVSEPVTGEGIFFALRSGMLAGQALHSAFQCGDLSAPSLRRYARLCRREFAVRRGLNALIRYSIYRPALLTSFLHFSARRTRLLESLVQLLCLPQPGEQGAGQ